MKRVTLCATALALALMVVFSWTAAAQQPDTRDRTIMTFSNAVELPGLRLEGGTYVFRLADTLGRNIIQVLDQDEKQVLGQWLFIPAERMEVTGDTVVTFRETAANTTPAVQFWYYPGEKIGKEFIYPKDQAMRIAARTGAAVMTEEGPVTASGQVAANAEPATQGPASVQADATLAPAQEQGAVAVETQAQGTTGTVEGSGLPADDVHAQAVGTSGRSEMTAQSSIRQEGTVAQADTNRNMNMQNDNSNIASELPATASPLALTGLLGLLSLAGAAGVRLFRQ